MTDLIELGATIMWLLMLLVGVLLIAARIHIHELRKSIRASEAELAAIRADLNLIRNGDRIPADGGVGVGELEMA